VDKRSASTCQKTEHRRQRTEVAGVGWLSAARPPFLTVARWMRCAYPPYFYTAAPFLLCDDRLGVPVRSAR